MGFGAMIDRVVAAMAPERGLRRFAARKRFELLATYDGAKKDRRDHGWMPQNKSADAAILPDFPTLLARARQLSRDNAWARSIRRSFARNVIGTGITALSAARFAGGAERRVFNREADELWKRWAQDRRQCDRKQRQTFAQMQWMAAGNLIEAGEVFIRFHNEISPVNGGVPLQLEMIEPEQLDDSLSRNSGNGNEIRSGVELDANGVAVAYWINARAPVDIGFELTPRPQRVPAIDMIHLFVSERPGQTRGVTEFAPVLRRLRNLDQYDETQLWVARLEACMGIAITKESDPSDARIGLDTLDAGDETDGKGNRELSFEPGAVWEFEPGEKAEFFSPSRPGNQYDPFIRTQLKAIAAGVGLSFAQVARDFSEGNFSSQRQALLEDRREWQPLQVFFMQSMIAPVRNEFIRAAAFGGLLTNSTGIANNPEPFCACEYRPQGWEWVDPQKEANAAKIAIENRLTTRKKILAEQGRDVREVLQQIADETEMAENLGITLPENVAPSASGRGDADGGEGDPDDGDPQGDDSDKNDDDDGLDFRELEVEIAA